MLFRSVSQSRYLQIIKDAVDIVCGECGNHGTEDEWKDNITTQLQNRSRYEEGDRVKIIDSMHKKENNESNNIWTGRWW